MKKKEARYEYFFSYVDRNNKFQNALADTKYLIDCRDMMNVAMQDLRRITDDNIRAIVNFQLLRKKFITVEVEEVKK